MKYYVTTWDADKQAFTPQRGVRTGPWSKWGLRRALRKLRQLGYACDYRSYGGVCYGNSDPSVMVESVGQ